MWLTNFGYWGFNQYIIQKGLAAKSLSEAKKGLLFASFLKILIPLLVVIPGITAFGAAQRLFRDFLKCWGNRFQKLEELRSQMKLIHGC